MIAAIIKVRRKIRMVSQDLRGMIKDMGPPCWNAKPWINVFATALASWSIHVIIFFI